jgi:hypothetical protein
MATKGESHTVLAFHQLPEAHYEIFNRKEKKLTPRYHRIRGVKILPMVLALYMLGLYR